MRVIDKTLAELHPYDKNPRKNDPAVDPVAASIAQFGFKVPIVIDQQGTIICGHTRYRAAKKLKLKTVPCIIADDLNEEQIKAFRIADNKVGEMADWDFDILQEELADIIHIDMEDFGFEFVDPEERLEKRRDKYVKDINGIFNMDIAQFETNNKYDIPELAPVHAKDLNIKGWTNFSRWYSDNEPEGKALNFFCHDYMFECIWNDPEKYLEKLRGYEAVLTPDFSPYSDMPLATQIYNHYRKHWVGAWMQQNGIKVIPTIRASMDPRSFEYYLMGEPKGGVVAISAMWTKDAEGRAVFEKEYNTMLDELHPEKVYVYGGHIEEMNLRGNIEKIATVNAQIKEERE